MRADKLVLMGLERKLWLLPSGDEHGAILCEATHKVDHPLLGSLLNAILKDNSSKPNCKIRFEQLPSGGQLLVETIFTWLFVSLLGLFQVLNAPWRNRKTLRAAWRRAGTAAPQAVEQHQMAARSLRFQSHRLKTAPNKLEPSTCDFKSEMLGASEDSPGVAGVVLAEFSQLAKPT